MGGLNINMLLIIAGIAAVCKMADGYRKGMVREMVSLISMVALCIVAPLIAYGVNSYHDGRIFNAAVAVILLGLLVTAHHLLGLVLFPAKLIAKLPVVHFADKLCGIVFGVFEVVLILWTVYAFAMMMDMGSIGQIILTYTEESSILSWLYRHNYVAYLIENFLERFSFVPLELL